MSGKDYLSIEWEGLKELEDLLDEMGDEIERVAYQEYGRYALLLEEGTKALVQRDTGDLESTINFAVNKTPEGIEIDGGSNSKYALRRHYEPYRKGKYPKYDNGAKFPDFYSNGLGLRTRSKRGFRGEKPGRLFLERAIKVTREDWDATNQRILKRVLNKRR